MSCKVTAGITNDCTDVLFVGGLGKTFWVGYKSDLDTQISTAQSADINTLDFGAYGGLYRFDGRKFSHSFSDSLTVAQGGNKAYTHTFTAKLLSKSTTDDVQLQKLALGEDIFIICQDNNEQFFILGASNGLSATAGERSSGQTGDADTSDTITLTGSEKTKALRFALGGGYQATLDYIESREV